MRRCVKCSLTFTDSSKICRSCGTILEDMADGPLPNLVMRGDEREQLELIAEQALSTVEQGSKDRLQVRHVWTCSRCAEKMPGKFDICWNCGTDRSGMAGPQDFETDAQTEPIESPPPNSAETAAVDAELRCTLCGSIKLVPNVQVVDQGKHSSGNLQLVVYGSPEALDIQRPTLGRNHGRHLR